MQWKKNAVKKKCIKPHKERILFQNISQTYKWMNIYLPKEFKFFGEIQVEMWF